MLRSVFALLALALGADAVARTSPPAGSIVVAKSGGQYTSLQAAINAISKTSTATTTIFIQPGTYTGQTYITSGYAGKIVVYAYTTDDQDYTKNEVVLTNSLSSSQAGGNEQSGTLRVHTGNAHFYNLRVVNSAGDAGPSHALSTLGSTVGFYGCAFEGWQDTMFGKNTASVFKNSYIEGAVDFIYGGTNVNFWFEKSVIANAREAGGYVTASGRESDDAGWYVINNSRVVAKSGVSVKSGSVWLGRPWRYYARTVYQNSELAGIIQSQGWNPWDKSDDLSNIYYGEYGNTGSGSSTSSRVSWSKKLSSAVSIDNTIPGWKDWVDQSYWNNTGGGTIPDPDPDPTPGTVPQWGQCGGSGWTGGTVCVSPFTCTVVNEWYSQCL